MFLFLLTYIIIHWNSLSLLLTQISLKQYHNLVSLYLITFLFSLTSILHPHLPTPFKFTFRRTKNINIIEFNNDVASFDLILHPPTSLPQLLDSYDSTLRSILDKHASLITKLSKPRKHNSWYTPALLALKTARRHLERKYIAIHSVSDYKIICTATNQYHKLIAHAKRQFNAQLIQSSIPTHVSSGKHKLLTTS